MILTPEVKDGLRDLAGAYAPVPTESVVLRSETKDFVVALTDPDGSIFECLETCLKLPNGTKGFAVYKVYELPFDLWWVMLEDDRMVLVGEQNLRQSNA